MKKRCSGITAVCFAKFIIELSSIGSGQLMTIQPTHGSVKSVCHTRDLTGSFMGLDYLTHQLFHDVKTPLAKVGMAILSGNEHGNVFSI